LVLTELIGFRSEEAGRMLGVSRLLLAFALAADEGLLLAPSGIVTVHRACGESVKGNPEWIASPADIERMKERIEERIENG
jgi:hypothetical protein